MVRWRGVSCCRSGCAVHTPQRKIQRGGKADPSQRGKHEHSGCIGTLMRAKTIFMALLRKIEGTGCHLIAFLIFADSGILQKH